MARGFSALIAGLAATTATACGGSAHVYAGMARTEAEITVMAGFADEIRNPSSPRYRHRVRLVRVVESHYPSGDDAWLVRVRDATEGENLCVWISRRPLGTDAYARPCGGRREPPSPPAAHPKSVPT